MAAAAPLLEAALNDMRHWPATQAVLGAFLGATSCNLRGKALVVVVGACRGSCNDLKMWLSKRAVTAS